MAILPNHSINVQTAHPKNHLNFDLELPCAERKALLITGDNGVGKSSLVKYLKLNKDQFWDKETSVNFVAQSEVETLDDLSLNNLLHLMDKRIARRQDEEFKNLKSVFKADEFSDKKFYQLSGGQKQIAKILLGVFFTAEVYIFDEPFQNLDQKNKKIFRNYLETLLENNKNVIVIEHNEDFLPSNIIKIHLSQDGNKVVAC